MSDYNTSLEIWKELGKDAFTKSIGVTASESAEGTRTIFSFTNDNWISGSVSIYTDGTQVTSSAYTLNLDDGKVTFTSAPNSGSAVTADYYYSGLPDSAVQNIISKADAELENNLGQSFTLTTTSEYIDVEDSQTSFTLENRPVNSIVSLSANTAESIADSPTWSASTEGIGNDYLLYSESGQIEYIDNKPLAGFKRLYATYEHGYSSADMPKLVKELHALYVKRQFIQNNLFQAIIQGRENFSPARTGDIDTRIMEIKKLLRRDKFEAI